MSDGSRRIEQCLRELASALEAWPGTKVDADLWRRVLSHAPNKKGSSYYEAARLEWTVQDGKMHGVWS